MEFNYYLQNCHDDDVIQVPNAIYKMDRLKNAMKFAFRNEDKIPYVLFHALQEKGVRIENISQLLDDGLYSEILKIGAKGWQKGKLRIKITIEFCPDQSEIAQPESPLDDLRQMLNQENQQ